MSATLSSLPHRLSRGQSGQRRHRRGRGRCRWWSSQPIQQTASRYVDQTGVLSNYPPPTFRQSRHVGHLRRLTSRLCPTPIFQQTTRSWSCRMSRRASGPTQRRRQVQPRRCRCSSRCHCFCCCCHRCTEST